MKTLRETREIKVGTNTDDLKKHIPDLDPNDPMTAWTVYLTSHTTFSKRSTRIQTHTETPRKGKSTAAPEDTAVPADEADEDEEDELDAEMFEALVSYLVYLGELADGGSRFVGAREEGQFGLYGSDALSRDTTW